MLFHERGSAKERIELLTPSGKTVLVRENDHYNVFPADDFRLPEAPTLRNDTPSPVARDRVTVLPYRNENGAGFRAAVWPDVEP